jgi:hypothetical protein
MFTIKAVLGTMLNPDEDGQDMGEVITDAVDRYNLITYLASRLMALHGKLSSKHHHTHHFCRLTHRVKPFVS